jgi:hypothetical protein
MAYTYGSHILAHDRRVLDILLQGRPQSRTSDLIVWTNTTSSVIRQRNRNGQALFHNSHQDIRLISPTRQRQNQLRLRLPTVTTAPAQLVLALIYSPFASAFSMQQPNLRRFQQALLTTILTFPGHSGAAKAITFQTSRTHTLD